MPKFEVELRWTRSFTRTVTVTAANEDAAADKAQTQMDKRISEGQEDPAAWDLDSDEVEVDSCEEAE